MIAAPALTPEMCCVFGLLALSVYLFVSEIVRVDVAAILVMLALGLLATVPGLDSIVRIADLFNGFASNTVFAVGAMMIMGAGLDKTGLMGGVANLILRVGGGSERRLIAAVAASAGLVSAVIQNSAVIVLFLPVVARLAARSGVPVTRLLMPMAFCVILGGTMTLVGSSPLILLNDLVRNSNAMLVPAQRIAEFTLFSVTPIGLALLATGVAYFVYAGRYVLPIAKTEAITWGGRTAEYFRRVYGLEADIFEVRVLGHSRLVGRRIDVVERASRVRIIAYYSRGENLVAPAGTRAIEGGAMLGVMAGPEAMKNFLEHFALEARPRLIIFADALMHTRSGISEVVIPPNSNLIGKTVREVRMRGVYGLAVLAIHRGGETYRVGVRDLPLKAGDTLVCHSAWENLARLERDPNFVVVTSEYPHQEVRRHKVVHALFFFIFALGLALFTDVRLALALLVGAMGMVVNGVLSMDEAYAAVHWPTMFLLASLIPLGQAVENTGAAAWIAYHIVDALRGVPQWVMQGVVALLATVFTQVMSNVGATTLLVPLAVNIAVHVGANPAVFALIVAIAASNSFLIPTNQVNTLIMGPGGYRSRDFLRAGGMMTMLFLAVLLTMIHWFY